VVKPITINLIITLAVTNTWDMFQLDVNNAFLTGLLKESVHEQTIRFSKFRQIPYLQAKQSHLWLKASIEAQV